jgi:hypothetical protein
VEALSFFAGALMHAGAALGPFREETVGPAVLVESLCGVALTVAAAAAIAEASGWRRVGIGAQVLALAGVLLGVAATTAGGGPSNGGNDMFHYTMIVLLGGGIAVLAFGARERRQQPEPPVAAVRHRP